MSGPAIEDVTGGAPVRGGMFRSLRRYNYRVWFVGALISNIGQWMQSTAQSWVVLTVLTHGDAGAMGLAMALQFGPSLLLVGVAGWAADRFPRRRLIAVTQSLLGLIALTVGVLLLTGAMTLPLMYGFAIALGVVTAFDVPTRQAFVTDIVGTGDAANAVALNSASFNSARLIGPAAAGVAIVVLGPGWVFLFNAVTFAATLVAIALIRPHELERLPPRDRALRLADGFRYIAGRADIAVLCGMAFIIGAFGMNFPIFGSTMALEFGTGADGFGLLTSATAIGSLAGALLSARQARARMRLAIAAVLLFGVTSAVSAVMPGYWAYAAMCVLTGFALVTTLTTINGYVQTTTDPGLRGRVIAVYMALLQGGTMLGAPIVGAIAAAWGAREAILVAAAAGLLAAAIGGVWYFAGGRVRRSAGKRFGVEVLPTRAITLPPAP